MGARWVILVLAVTAGCEKKKPRLDGPVEVALGDCAPTTIAFVSGPRPLKFDPTKLEEERDKAKDKKQVAAAEDPPPPEDEDPDAGGEGGFASLTGTGDISSGFDDADIYGGLLGDEVGEMRGGFGFGRTGPDSVGGGTGWGTIGTGRYGKIGHGSGYGVGGRGGMRGRTGAAPTTRIGQPVANGALDKAIIRRYVKRNIQKIMYCYEKELLVKPKLAGTVMVEFFIQPSGSVAQSTGTGVDGEVARCVARVIKAIEFPKPKGGGGVQVNYPFTFRPAGGTPPVPSPTVDPPADPDGGGTAMALEEGTMGKKDADRAEGQYKMKKAADDPKLAAGGAQPYKPGAGSPLKPVTKELEECFRLQTKRHGVAVIDLAGDTLTAHGIENAEFKKCVAGLAKKVTSKQPQRCSIAFGPMPLAEAPGVEITQTEITFLGTRVANTLEVVNDDHSFKIPALFEAADKRNLAMRESSAPVVMHGPLLVKPLDVTPIRVVNTAVISLLMAGEDPVLAAQRGGEWKPLRPLAALPVVPVPIGTGGSWSSRGGRPRAGFVASDEETVKLSILVMPDQIWVGLSRVNEFQEIKGHDLAKLAEVLASHKKSPFFVDRADVEIAGEATVYGDVVEVIETATKAGFVDWEFNDPAGLSARPQL